MDHPKLSDINTSENFSYESEYSTKENMDFLDKLFTSGEFASKLGNVDFKSYYDDNGIKYRSGDTLVPDTTFQINGYIFATDDLGRTAFVHALLRMADSEYPRKMDSMEVIGNGDQKENDQRGHLIGHQFGGSDGIENLVPMDGKLNQGDYKKLEMMLADAVKDHCEVYLDIEPRYIGESKRPTSFIITYSIDGEKDVAIFQNDYEV